MATPRARAVLLVLALCAAVSPAAASLNDLHGPPDLAGGGLTGDRVLELLRETARAEQVHDLADASDAPPFTLWPDPPPRAGQLFVRTPEPPLLEPAVLEPWTALQDAGSLPKTRVRAFGLFEPRLRQGSSGVSRETATGYTLGLRGTYVGPTQKGLWTDPVTGMAYARARWYDARNAAWLSEDPLLDIDSPNLYAFVAWQPTMATDPMGRACETEHGGINRLCNPMDEMELSSDTPWWEYAWAVAADAGGNTLTEALFLNVFADAPHVVNDPEASGGEKAVAGGKAVGAAALNLGGAGVAVKAGLGRLAATRPVQWTAQRLSQSRAGKRLAGVLMEDVGVLWRRALGRAKGPEFFADLARQSTRNPGSNRLVLGKWQQDGKSYTKVAAHYRASYFKATNYRELTKTLTPDELWKINEAFLDQQIRAGKQIFLSHDPSNATGFFLREVQYLEDLGYRFVQEDWVWKAVR